MLLGQIVSVRRSNAISSFTGWAYLLKENTRSVFSLGDAINPLRPNNDVSQTSQCNIKGVSVSEVMRIENMITQVQFY